MKSDVWTKFVQTSDFTVKALITLNSLNRRNFYTMTDMRVKICFYAKLCTQNKIFGSKMQHLKQQKTSAFTPLILKRWIGTYTWSKLFHMLDPNDDRQAMHVKAKIDVGE